MFYFGYFQAFSVILFLDVQGLYLKYPSPTIDVNSAFWVLTLF